MKTKVILAGLLTCIGIGAQAQDIKTEEPKGKAIVQVFEKVYILYRINLFVNKQHFNGLLPL